MAGKHNCENCKFRSLYDKNNKSILGRIWLWHANWCPGFKNYITSLPEPQRIEIAKRYTMTKYMK